MTPAVGRPRFSGSSADLWRGLLWVVLGIILGLVVWRVLAAKQRAASAARGERPGQTLGPWPVAPDLVRTRGELIQAFEYLSLLLLGSRARSWHHQQIAVSLAVPETQQDRREAVLDLAALYETARYAPPTQPVPEQDLARARCHLCFLAGVSAT